MNTVARHFFLAALGSMLIACGAAGAEGAAPSTPPMEPAPTTVEEAQAQLDRARADLDRNVGSTVSTPPVAAEAAPSTQSTQSMEPRPPPAPPADAAPSKGSGSGASEPRALTPCEQACRALGSMRRAKEAICRMTSDADERCSRAGKVVAEGEARASSCGCPAR